MEALLDAADDWIARYPDEPPRPDFPLPSDYDPAAPERIMEQREGLKGRGWFAKSCIPAGTVLLVEKPISMVMDWLEPLADDSEVHNSGAPQSETTDYESVGAADINDGDEPKSDETDGETGLEIADDDGEFMETSSSSLKVTDPVDEKTCEDSKLSEIMLLDLLSMIQQNDSLWTDQLSQLFPRDADTICKLPAWVCSDDEVFIQVEHSIQALATDTSLLPEYIKDLNLRLPLIIRYNVLSVETCPELLVHPGLAGHARMSGMGIFHNASFFNHDSKPNVSRYAVGDIMWFVANQEISEGVELCISYLEHDVLCEPANRRTMMLGRDFGESEGDSTDYDILDLPVIDDEIQNELMAVHPIQRLEDLEQLMAQATGKNTVGAMDDDGDSLGWFQCDVQNLRIIHAVTLDALGRSTQALPVWDECVSFTERSLPPNDEASVVMRVQAALCALHSGDMARAHTHAAKALETHNLIFGGGVARFLRRYKTEFKLALRPETADNAPNVLWPSS